MTVSLGSETPSAAAVTVKVAVVCPAAIAKVLAVTAVILVPAVKV
ncbi:hypothetical protein [Nostoc sp.]